MSSELVIHGVVKLDGTLELEEKVALPPGRVQVTVASLPNYLRTIRFGR